MSLNSIAMNLEAQETGVWETVHNMDFLIARAGNKSWKKLQKTLTDQYYGQGRKRAKTKSEKDLIREDEILVECLAKTCILDWKRVKVSEGDEKELKYTPEKCFEILSDKRYQVLTRDLLDIALDEERFLEESIREDEAK